MLLLQASRSAAPELQLRARHVPRVPAVPEALRMRTKGEAAEVCPSAASAAEERFVVTRGLGRGVIRACRDPTLAAPRCRKSNFVPLDAVLEWYRILRTLPGMEAAVAAQKEK